MRLVSLSILIATLWSATVIPLPALPLSKKELCAIDVGKANKTLALLRVSQEEIPRYNDSSRRRYPRILCFAVTYSVHHETRVRATAETWGQRCDKLLFFSNMSDTIVVAANTSAERRFKVVQLDIIADHKHLWLRTRAALTYLHESFRHDYDWFYKCDDDTYMIVENMRAYLRRPEILERFHRQPMQLGHRLDLPKNLLESYVQNKTELSLWYSRYDRMVFNSGGAGYVMNRLYLDKIVESLPKSTCLPEGATVPIWEDVGVSFCMTRNDVYPWDTRDHRGRDRWHTLSPHNVYIEYKAPNDWYIKYHKTLGGLRHHTESVAPDSVAFHYINPQAMYHLERILYLCRSEHDDVSSYNTKFGLAIGDKVMVVEAS
ncbi:unnamed protein product [Peronospora belbahrii]|uniref:N-acetylgalactosaminide beta-1,3-galactosyltransferase n=1 Tax=Peronospora belbahrii TaxID=622444 RepID=A0AAU9KX02_9STRA|nr:unnamed protein product [Peronospora belbahrii]CAH0516311.1 unnamed protein product [Peronospora belbahrii]